jgi:tetratricopeptide (TPR) repeat protein
LAVAAVAFQRALDLETSNPLALTIYSGLLLLAQGCFDEAIALSRKAEKLDRANLAVVTGVGRVLYVACRHEEAIRQYGKAIELDPGLLETYVNLTWALGEAGRCDDFRALLPKLRPGSVNVPWARAKCGEAEAVRREIAATGMTGFWRLLWRRVGATETPLSNTSLSRWRTGLRG